jgi:cbb3-type cytochrome oxidase maturation protein
VDILFLLIPLSVVLVFLIGAVFWLALKGGQFDDLESPGLKIVLDDDRPPPEERESDAMPEQGDGARRTGAAGNAGKT